jgi:hypothetical protein
MLKEPENKLIHEKETLKNYLTYIYHDLITQERESEEETLEQESEKLLTLNIFKKYLTYASLISENMFRVFDKFTRGKLTLEDFSKGIIDLLTFDLKKLIKLLFEFCDFNWYNKVYVDDVKLFLIYLDPRRDGVYKNKLDKSLLDEFEYLIYDRRELVKSGSSTSDIKFTEIFNSNIQLNLEEFEHLFINTEIIVKIQKLIHDGIPICLDNLKVFKKEFDFNENLNQIQPMFRKPSSSSTNVVADRTSSRVAESRSRSPNDRQNFFKFDSMDFGESMSINTSTLRDPSSRNKMSAFNSAAREASSSNKMSMYNSMSRDASREALGRNKTTTNTSGLRDASRDASREALGRNKTTTNTSGLRDASREALGRNKTNTNTSGLRDASREASIEAFREASSRNNLNIKTLKTRSSLKERSQSPAFNNETYNSNSLTPGESRTKDSSENPSKSDEIENEKGNRPVIPSSSKFKKSKFCTNNNENNTSKSPKHSLRQIKTTNKERSTSLSRANTDQPSNSPMNSYSNLKENTYQEAYEDSEKFTLNLNKDISDQILKSTKTISRQNSSTSVNSSNVSPSKKRSSIRVNSLTISMSKNNSSNEILENEKLNTTCERNKIIFQGFVYKKTKEDKLRKFYIVFVNKDIIYFNSTREKFRGLHNVSNYFAEQGEKVTINGSFYFSFHFVYQKKRRTYYCESLWEAQAWLRSLEKATNFRNIEEFYDIFKDLGKGHFGEVRLGLDRMTLDQIAVKTINKSKLQPHEHEIIMGESEIMKKCNHRNILKLIDKFESFNGIYLVLEHLDRGNLVQFVISRKKLDEKMARRIMIQIAEGINYLHNLGIVHRDLKAENVMLNDKLEVKIIDFGMSKPIGKENKFHQKMGTLAYAAPEILTGEGYSKGVDIWSLGIILYFVLTGRLPFDDIKKTVVAIAKRIDFIENYFPDKLFGDVSTLAMDLIRKCVTVTSERIDIKQVLEHPWFKVI